MENKSCPYCSREVTIKEEDTQCPYCLALVAKHWRASRPPDHPGTKEEDQLAGDWDDGAPESTRYFARRGWRA